jgi:hypothetical protein
LEGIFIDSLEKLSLSGRVFGRLKILQIIALGKVVSLSIFREYDIASRLVVLFLIDFFHI